MTYWIACFALFLIWDMSRRGEFLTTEEIVFKGVFWTVAVLLGKSILYLLGRK